MKYMNGPNSAAVKDIYIDVADILGQKYRYRIGIGHGDIHPSLIVTEGSTSSKLGLRR